MDANNIVADVVRRNKMVEEVSRGAVFARQRQIKSAGTNATDRDVAEIRYVLHRRLAMALLASTIMATSRTPTLKPLEQLAAKCVPLASYRVSRLT